MIARQFMTLLEKTGYPATLASRLRTWSQTGENFNALSTQAETEAENCIARENAEERPKAAFVFTYHNYYKAPDIIGPQIARRLGIPYILAESSRAPKRATGSHAQGHRLAEMASDAAALILTPTLHDQEMLDALKPANQRVVRLPPFLDSAAWEPVSAPHPRIHSRDEAAPIQLLTVAMMRDGYKTESYFKLADLLDMLPTEHWTLDIVGDGDNRSTIENRFEKFGSRIRFHGAVNDQRMLGQLYAQADIFVWPAISEPIGMVFLEAQAHGLPCIAFGYRGVPDVIQNGVTGVVVTEGDDALFATALTELIREAPRRFAMSAAARSFIRHERSMEGAATVLREALAAVMPSG